jgi:hypothetical protein
MKKLLLVMAIVMGALVVNAQRTPVKVSDLPKGVADSIQKEYSGYTIKESSKNIENNVTTYEVIVSKGTEQKTLRFDNQGKSLSKGSMDKSKSPDSWDMDKDKSKTPNTDMDKTKTTPSSTTPSSTSPSYPSSSSPSSSPSSTTPSSTPSPASTDPK